MSIGKLIEFFSMFTRLPIYAEDVRDQILQLGVQDEINFEPLDAPPERLLGMFLRTRKRNGLYADHVNVSTVFYNSNVTPDEQNFICCKELMHVFDPNITSGVRNAAELEQLLQYLFEEASQKSSFSTSVMSGFLDEAALFMAFAVMFPEDVRVQFQEAHSAGRMSHNDIARELGIPAAYVPPLLTPQWDGIRNILLRLR